MKINENRKKRKKTNKKNPRNPLRKRIKSFGLYFTLFIVMLDRIVTFER